MDVRNYELDSCNPHTIGFVQNYQVVHAVY
jgi:hypothetical protein